MESAGPEQSRPFLESLRSAPLARDAMVLLSIPLALLAVFSLPHATRRALTFAYMDPSLATAYASTFVHLDIGHLLVNVGGYLVVAPLAYVLSVLSGRRRRFFVAFATILLVFPFALSYLNLAIPRASVGYGFSGILMAFVGYLAIALGDFADARFDAGSTETLAPAFFFFGLALAAVMSVRSTLTVGLAVASLLSAFLYVRPLLGRPRPLRSNVRAAAGVAGHFELFAIGLVVFFAFHVVAFPADPVAGDSVVNVYVHLLGFALAFVATYATVEVGNRLPGREAWV